MSNGGKAVPLNLPEWAGCRMDGDFVGGEELWVDQPRHRAGSLPTPRMQPTGRSGAKFLARNPPVAPLRKRRIVRARATMAPQLMRMSLGGCRTSNY